MRAPHFLIILIVLRDIKGCAIEWNKHRKKGDRFIHTHKMRDFLKTDTTVFKYAFGNKWIVNYGRLLPHLKKNKPSRKQIGEAYMAHIGIKNQSLHAISD